jgi:type VI secretion system secreted protein Hcp
MKRLLLCIGLTAGALLAQAPAQAAVDSFLMLDGIKGESTDKTHQDWIEISSFSFGVSHPTTIGSGTSGAGAGKASFSDLSITKTVDKSSPALFFDAASGKHIKDGLLDVVKVSGGSEISLLEYKLTDVMISSYSIGGSSGGELPQESLSLNFTKIEFKEFPQNPTGSPGIPITVEWDLLQNKGIGPVGSVPEPGTVAMLMAGLSVLGLQVARRRRA